MGQYWKLFNLDKCEYASCGGAKMGEFFFRNYSETFLLNLLLSGQPDHNIWAGDRIILLGDYSAALPPNTVTDHDAPILKGCVVTDQPESNSRLCAYMKLDEHCKEIDTIPGTSSLLPDDTVYILRSLNKKEYVRRDIVKNYRIYPEMTREPGLSQALYTLIGWSEDPSASLSYEDTGGFVPASGGTMVALHRGAWAGNRIDTVALTDEVQKTLDEEGWTDISEEKARHVSDIYAADDH
ncbi:hypothetical protein D9619_010271 [Psilocybe cf. subviscida]|uniref:Uncharacterized protein n=1 Tax=Psilocybe cf. subviscida TaxID=2480587 RepID=A0A8H5ERY3_9AGAR|nr:hypothetical protein D9619_010271 [Psilocybe cf. subviscida]